MKQAYLYDAIRTPFGKIGGSLSSHRPDDLAAHVVRELVARAPQLDPASIDESIFGNANGAGEENRNVARMATLLAGLPTSLPGTTMNRLCGSSLDAAIAASRQVNTDDADLVLVGGVESMSRAPWVLPKTERPFPMANLELANTTLGWRLVNPAMPKEWTVSLGEATEQLREKYEVTREDQDEFAALSHKLAAEAWANGKYNNLVVAVPPANKRGTEVTMDETIRPGTTAETLARLKPAFTKDGTITAGTASQISDGAAAVVVTSADYAERAGLNVLAEIGAHGNVAGPDNSLHSQPANAIKQALAKAGLAIADLDLIEINEAFSVVALQSMRELGVSSDIVNVNGGAIAIGHPIGASGARLAVHLCYELARRGGGLGAAALCGGGGQGEALLLRVRG